MIPAATGERPLYREDGPERWRKSKLCKESPTSAVNFNNLGIAQTNAVKILKYMLVVTD